MVNKAISLSEDASELKYFPNSYRLFASLFQKMAASGLSVGHPNI
jgi:hypothetical protein